MIGHFFIQPLPTHMNNLKQGLVGPRIGRGHCVVGHIRELLGLLVLSGQCSYILRLIEDHIRPGQPDYKMFSGHGEEAVVPVGAELEQVTVQSIQR